MGEALGRHSRGAGGAKLPPTWQQRARGCSVWGKVVSLTMQKESGFRPSCNWSHLLLSALACRVAGKGLGHWKNSQSCGGTGLRRRERDGGEHAVGLESRAVVCHGSRVWESKKVGWEGGSGNFQESFSRGSDYSFGTTANLSNLCPRHNKGEITGWGDAAGMGRDN